jgi:hypothetical protein
MMILGHATVADDIKYDTTYLFILHNSIHICANNIKLLNYYTTIQIVQQFLAYKSTQNSSQKHTKLITYSMRHRDKTSGFGGHSISTTTQ